MLHTAVRAAYHWHSTPQERLHLSTKPGNQPGLCRPFSLRQRVILHAFLTKRKGWSDASSHSCLFRSDKVQLKGTGRCSCLRTLMKQRWPYRNKQEKTLQNIFQYSYCCISIWKVWQTWPMKIEINNGGVFFDLGNMKIGRNKWCSWGCLFFPLF